MTVIYQVFRMNDRRTSKWLDRAHVQLYYYLCWPSLVQVHSGRNKYMRQLGVLSRYGQKNPEKILLRGTYFYCGDPLA